MHELKWHECLENPQRDIDAWPNAFITVTHQMVLLAN